MQDTPSLKCRKLLHADVTGSQEETDDISILQYNILADAAIPRYVQGVNMCGDYTYCPTECRYMDNRHSRIMAEVKSVSADVVTLQEVEADHLYDGLLPDMKELGYTGVCHVRWFDHIGLAIFYKTSRFELVSEKAFIIHTRLKDLLQCSGATTEEAHFLENYMKETSSSPGVTQPPGCLMVNLQCKQTLEIVCVANVHITCKQHRYPVLHILQASCAFAEANKFCKGHPCIFAGDFNSTPEMPLYHFITDGGVTERTINLLSSGKDYLDGNMTVCGKHVSQILKDFRLSTEMKSAYVSVMGKEPLLTNCDEMQASDDQVGLFNGCLDYIWYTPDSLHPVAVLDVPDEHLIHEQTGLPNVIFPSDHLPVYAALRFKSKSEV